MIAETETDTAQIAMKGGDQLWIARPHAGLATAGVLPDAAPRQGRFAHKRRRARAQAEVQRRLSEHLLDPAQLELFPAPPRDWTRLDTTRPPALTAAAADLVADFITYMRGRGWNTDSFSGSVRTLRIVTGHLGAEVPIQETDIRALASMRTTLHGPPRRQLPPPARPARSPTAQRSLHRTRPATRLHGQPPGLRRRAARVHRRAPRSGQHVQPAPQPQDGRELRGRRPAHPRSMDG